MKRSLLVATMMVLLGCGTPQPAATAVQAPVDADAGSDGGATSGCPMMLSGVTASAADVDGGVAITFTAPDNEVAALRQHLGQMAQQRGNMMWACCASMGADAGAAMMQGTAGVQGMMGDAGGDAGMPMQCMAQMQGMMQCMAQMQSMKMPPADARVDDVAGGARLSLRAKDPADVPALRSVARKYVTYLQSGCPMM